MPCCAKCNKTHDTEAQMRKCCQDTYYCNRKCERADFQNHKASCLKPVFKVDKAPAPLDAPLMKKIYKSFHRLKRGDYLQGRPDTDVYKLLIDAYRLRMEDNDVYAGIHYEDSIYGDATDGLEGFRMFLDRAKVITHMMPSWWSDNKQAECEELGRQEGWSSLSEKIDATSVHEHYSDKFIDIQLRMLAEDIYGTGIGDRQTRLLRDKIMTIPNNTNTEIGASMRVSLSYHLLELFLWNNQAVGGFLPAELHGEANSLIDSVCASYVQRYLDSLWATISARVL
ncbi:hypothetical protein E0Z10_g4125 [Xylaria hypoxylon]|uniref:MYND-type domain-containing protein n=1 Tax=Xylaria hypoxylon TaxID=37992 RepID=A0A4Z0YZL9_9PEZI|nr:hypothetical protein E0Z10_g4125 [Xylaria hypoxylon]